MDFVWGWTNSGVPDDGALDLDRARVKIHFRPVQRQEFSDPAAQRSKPINEVRQIPANPLLLTAHMLAQAGKLFRIQLHPITLPFGLRLLADLGQDDLAHRVRLQDVEPDRVSTAAECGPGCGG
ncbi:hypothetical protein [Saccharopolyspora erythraea]|nr:hypothetical protein [Saccharopolyspora erythraea]QRK90713.1 hypothetical protein JQX30_04245 [Saccharopolyspora erythraea]